MASRLVFLVSDICDSHEVLADTITALHLIVENGLTEEKIEEMKGCIDRSRIAIMMARTAVNQLLAIATDPRFKDTGELRDYLTREI